MRVPMLAAFKYLIERSAFDFFSALGDWMKVSSGSTRLFFIYTTFVAVSSPLIFFLGFGFLHDMRKHFRRRRSVVWDS